MHLILLVIMPFRRNNRRYGLSLRPVNRIKHVVDEQGALVAGTQQNSVLIRAVETPLIANRDNILVGATVNAIFLVVEITATSSAVLPNAYLIVTKNPGNNLTLPGANTVGSDDNKRYVIHQEMVMLQKQSGSNPRTLFKGVIVLPRGSRRFSTEDRLVLSLLTPGITADYCFQAHYKEFR